MQKKLHLMSETQLRSYCESSRELKSYIPEMSAADIKENTKYVLESARINEIDSKGNVKFEIDGKGTAHIPVTGMLTDNVTPSAAFEGKSITTYKYITKSTLLADANPDVKKIRYHFSTGGGEAAGIEQASNAMFFAKTPTEAIVTTAAESGGLWLASQTDKIISAGKLETFGSLGVAAEFKDKTEAEEKEGIKSIILTSADAPEKRFDIKTDKGQKIVIKRLDEIHKVFVEHVLRGRQKVKPEITADCIKKNFGQGGSFNAEAALAVGMIDEIEGVTTNNAGVAIVASTVSSASSAKPGQAPAISTKEKMNEKQFLAFLDSNPDAKAFYENQLTVNSESIATMRTEHATALTKARTEIEGNKLSVEDANFVEKILMSSEYLVATKQPGIQVFKGELDIKMFKMLVANVDQTNELIKQAKIQNNQPADTRGQDHDLDSDESQATVHAASIGAKFGTAKKGA